LMTVQKPSGRPLVLALVLTLNRAIDGVAQKGSDATTLEAMCARRSPTNMRARVRRMRTLAASARCFRADTFMTKI
jgi:hypothetical protein